MVQARSDVKATCLVAYVLRAFWSVDQGDTLLRVYPSTSRSSEMPGM